MYLFIYLIGNICCLQQAANVRTDFPGSFNGNKDICCTVPVALPISSFWASRVLLPRYTCTAMEAGTIT